MTETNSGNSGINVEYVAKLARMHLTQQEQVEFQGQLEQILGYVKKLNEVDLGGIEPTSHSHPVNNVFRKDEVVAGLERDRVMDNAPEQADGQFVVPRIME